MSPSKLSYAYFWQTSLASNQKTKMSSSRAQWLELRQVPSAKNASSTLYILILFVVVIYQFKLTEHGILCAYSSAYSGHQRGSSSTHETNNVHFNTRDNSRLSNVNGQTGSSTASRHRMARKPFQRLRRTVYLALNGTATSKTSRSSTTNEQLYQNDQPPILDRCCACDEAKYELVFEGLWSRYTHPDDFPENYWLAHFSDIIGASHSNEFRMWSHDDFASDGVKELAEIGSTKKLEAELKQVSSKTRTIIKARELRYPTLNSRTSAVFRTDRQHHLVSILSKLGPSPDWMVGVSSLELCQQDCTWAALRVVNLHLWDAGTDSGTSFTAPDQPTRPQERIHPFKKLPNHSTMVHNGSQPSSAASSPPEEQVFSASFDSSRYQARRSSEKEQSYLQDSFNGVAVTSSVTNNDATKPFARLTITRQRTYEKSCSGEYNAQTVRQLPINQPTINLDTWTPEVTKPAVVDCRYTEWSDWSTCSSTCGKGIRTRTRSFVDEQAHLYGCSQVDLIEKEVCLSECIGNNSCVTKDWSEWSRCSVNCGQGHRKRTRSPIGPMRKVCESIELAEVEPCTGSQLANCSAEPTSCDVTEWSQWSECSVACGKGTRIRTRQYLKKDGMDNCSAKLIQKQSCTGRLETCKQNGKGLMVSQAPNPHLPVIDCKLSAWSPWSTCSALCGNGRRTRSRYIIQMPQNGGKPCDKKLSRTQKCKDLPPCPQYGTSYSSNQPAAHLSGKTDSKTHWRSSMLSTTTTPGSSMMDDEDDSKFSRLLQSESAGIPRQNSFNSNVSIVADGSVSSTEMKLIVVEYVEERNHEDSDLCKYGNWSQWSECEVVCQPVKKGSNKVRHKRPLNIQNDRCHVLEELYYCDPEIYC